MIRFRCQKEPLGSWCDHVEEEGQAAGRPEGERGAGAWGQGPNSGSPGEARENGTDAEMISGHSQPVPATLCVMSKAGEKARERVQL